MSIFFIFVSDDWFSRNYVPTMRDNRELDEFYIFLDKKILTRSSMCVEDI